MRHEFDPRLNEKVSDKAPVAFNDKRHEHHRDDFILTLIRKPMRVEPLSDSVLQRSAFTTVCPASFRLKR